MIYKNKEGIQLATQNVKYLQHGEEKEQIVGSEGEQWWIDFADKWEHTEIIEFVDIEYTNEQLERFEEIKDIAIAENILNDYVINGMIGEGLALFSLKKENEHLKQTLADLTETVLLGGI